MERVEHFHVNDWSPDGRTIVVEIRQSDTSNDLRDARVVQRGQCLGLTLEPRHTVGVGGKRCRKHLQRDVTMELGVPGAVDLAHATRAKRPATS